MRKSAWVIAGLALAFSGGSAGAETVKVGISKLIGYPGVPVALDRGYFKAEGLDVEMVFFDSAQPIAIAAASGDVEFGVSGMSASFYTLAAQGQLRLIASSGGDAPGFYNLAFVASNKAYDAGLKSPHDLRGHTIAITQVGTSLHYAIGQLAERDGFPMSAVTVKPLQSNTNVMAALVGGMVDAAVMPSGPVLMPLQKGDIKLLAWTAEVAANPSGSLAFVSTKAANQRGDMVKRFLTAYRHGLRDFHDAFVGPDGKRKDGPGAPAMLTFMANFTGVAVSELTRAIPFIDPEGRIDVDSVAHQIAWYKSQNLLKGDIDAKALIDNRYALAKVASK
jgi:NitT/TauT family transport system substrate-binding protein